MVTRCVKGNRKKAARSPASKSLSRCTACLAAIHFAVSEHFLWSLRDWLTSPELTNFAQKKLPVRLERGKFSVWREKSGSDTEDWVETEFFLGLTVSILKKGTSRS